MVSNETIGLRLLKLRNDLGKSQKEVAEAVGASDSAIGAYENGERIPRDEMKVKLSSYFGVSVASIFFD